jgi:ubiquitin fusion degradation protein 1
VDKAHLDEGGKIILPNSAMDELAHLNIVWPMMFKLIAPSVATHCGVLEFSAEEGHIYIPYWMMEHLRVKPGTIISVKNASLPKGKFVKLRPQTKNFIEDISNPRPVLEAKLRNFSCLTQGDTIMINYNDVNYCIDIMEVRSSKGTEEAVCIVDTDVEVDFDRPADMPVSPTRPPQGQSSLVEPSSAPLTFSNAHLNRNKKKKEEEDKKQEDEEPKFKAFSGAGRTMSGKPNSLSSSSSSPSTSPLGKGSPLGSQSPPSGPTSGSPGSKGEDAGFKAFTGKARSLK